MKQFFGEITKEFFPDLGIWLMKIWPFLGTVVFTEIFKKYIFSDFNYLIFLGVVMTLDVLAKVYSIFDKKERFDFDVLVKKFSLKVLKYFIFVSAMHVFLKLEIEGRTVDFGFYIKYLVYSLLITNDVRSILAHLGIKLPAEVARFFDRNKTKNTEDEIKHTFADGGDGPATPPVKPPNQ